MLHDWLLNISRNKVGRSRATSLASSSNMFRNTTTTSNTKTTNKNIVAIVIMIKVVTPTTACQIHHTTTARLFARMAEASPFLDGELSHQACPATNRWLLLVWSGVEVWLGCVMCFGQCWHQCHRTEAEPSAEGWWPDQHVWGNHRRGGRQQDVRDEWQHWERR